MINIAITGGLTVKLIVLAVSLFLAIQGYKFEHELHKDRTTNQHAAYAVYHLNKLHKAG